MQRIDHITAAQRVNNQDNDPLSLAAIIMLALSALLAIHLVLKVIEYRTQILEIAQQTADAFRNGQSCRTYTVEGITVERCIRTVEVK